jgi:hypothetical protein
MSTPQTEANKDGAATGLALATGSVSGVLTRAGTFPIRDEETTGVVVSMTVEELRAVEFLPMYRRVFVVESDALSFRRFEHILRKHGLIDPAALDDPEGFDNYRTHGAVHAAHRELLSQNTEPRNADGAASP